MKLTYNDIKNTFELKECKLLTTKDDFKNNKMNGQSKYTLIAKCGHQVDNCWFHMFKYRNTGVLCKKCIDSKKSENNINLNKNIEGNSYCLNIEFESVKIFKKYINLELLDIKMSPECCGAELCIKDELYI